MDYRVILGWDDEAGVFYVVESEIEGLTLEAATRDGLIDKIRDVAAELVEHNHGARGPFAVQILERVGQPLSLVAA